MSNIEISFENRPCLVDGKKAIFHRWTVDEKLYLKYDVLLKNDRERMIYDKFKEKNICGPECHIEKISHLVGLIEHEDGSISFEEPINIQFADSYGRFKEYVWEV